eukprot:CAMPEP_0181297508 /NCGR_PEP_ID=MMETSP1101-20121128/5277_1 /TAXON_ID=46948 /ORGANISM="Rhodomonas abbreviata, Strain Caron Lab Isolate" /LENGTH=377 /DNA_ID=CAMNT_0023402449 /DNA_START=69 /DNA_END=1199 /DNA_ORIENTATION=-
MAETVSPTEPNGEINAKTDKFSQKKTSSGGPMKFVYPVVGFIHVVVLYLEMFFSTNVLPTLSFFFCKLVSRTLHHGIIAAMGAVTHKQVLVWMERVGGLTPIYYGDYDLLRTKYVSSKLVISNHQSFTDSVLLYGLAWRNGHIGHMKAIAKKGLMFWPIIGVLWLYSNFIFLSRDFLSDAPNIQRQLKTLSENAKRHSSNFWLMIYPEGTRCRPGSIAKGQEYSKSKGLPVFTHTLVPRVKGCQVMLPAIHDVIDAVVDVTIGYKERTAKGKIIPSLESLLFGGGRKYDVHFHIRVIPVAEVPNDEDKIHDWLMKVFDEKNKLLQDFEKTGVFPAPVKEEDVYRPSLFVDVIGNICVHFFVMTVVVAGMYYGWVWGW